MALGLTGCELAGFFGEAQARELAVKRCDEPRLQQVQPPTNIRAEFMTVDAAMRRGLQNIAPAPNQMVWLVTLEGTWMINGGPAFIDNPNRPPLIFHRCIVVLDAKTGVSLMTNAEP